MLILLMTLTYLSVLFAGYRFGYVVAAIRCERSGVEAAKMAAQKYWGFNL